VSDFSVCVIIPAAGRGERFGGEKVSQEIGGRPMLLRTVEIFTRRPEVSSVIVAAPPDGMDAFASRFGAQLGFHGVKVVPGGRVERWETVSLALEHVPEGATHVAVHDAARPCTSDELVSRVFDAARIAPAVIPGEPVRATLKRVSAGQVAAAADDAIADAILGDAGRDAAQGRMVEETISRERVVAVQTPQVFELSLLRRAYAQPDLAGVTDDAMLVERLGEPVLVVDGEVRNIKVTTKEDLLIARAFATMPTAAAPRQW
jgi:2-C-methyl-D-erythritol 4-phosphate cytidylyltransferase